MLPRTRSANGCPSNENKVVARFPGQWSSARLSTLLLFVDSTPFNPYFATKRTGRLDPTAAFLCVQLLRDTIA